MKRRGPGEGSIYQRGDGRWCAAMTIAPGDRRYFYGRTRAEVRERLRDAQHLLDEGRLPNPTRQTLAQFLERWRDDLDPNMRRHTYRTYSLYVRHICAQIGHIHLKDLRPDHIQRCYTTLASHLAPGTVHRLHVVLRMALNQAVEWDFILRNPTDGTRPPAIPSTTHHVLSPDQLIALLRATHSDQNRTIYHLLATTGLRVNEALALRWSDLDEKKRAVCVTRSLDFYGKEPSFGPTKTKSSRRTVHLTDEVFVDLMAHKQRLRFKAQGGEIPELMFTAKYGKPVRSNVLGWALKQDLNRAGLSPITVHELRHTAARILLKNGVPMQLVQPLLGHASIKTTIDVYGDLLDPIHEMAARAMGTILREANARHDAVIDAVSQSDGVLQGTS
jgi:integrase